MPIQRREFIANSIVLSAGMLLPSDLVRSVLAEAEYDIVIYGASSAGIIAAVAAARKRRSVIIVEPSNHLGGLTARGLSQTDIGVEGEGGAIGGLSFDFYRQIRQYYTNDDAWTHQTWDEHMGRTDRLQPDSEEMFGFEPHVARKIYEEMLEDAAEPAVELDMDRAMSLALATDLPDILPHTIQRITAAGTQEALQVLEKYVELVDHPDYNHILQAGIDTINNQTE